MVTDPWRREAFVASLASVSSNTVAAYGRDLMGFITWAERLDMSHDQALAHHEIGRHLREGDPAGAWHLEREREILDGFGSGHAIRTPGPAGSEVGFADDRLGVAAARA